MYAINDGITFVCLLAHNHILKSRGLIKFNDSMAKLKDLLHFLMAKKCVESNTLKHRYLMCLYGIRFIYLLYSHAQPQTESCGHENCNSTTSSDKHSQPHEKLFFDLQSIVLQMCMLYVCTVYPMSVVDVQYFVRVVNRD